MDPERNRLLSRSDGDLYASGSTYTSIGRSVHREIPSHLHFIQLLLLLANKGGRSAIPLAQFFFLSNTCNLQSFVDLFFVSYLCKFELFFYLCVNVSSSVADPCHFGVDPDPDPRIHASD